MIILLTGALLCLAGLWMTARWLLTLPEPEPIYKIEIGPAFDFGTRIKDTIVIQLRETATEAVLDYRRVSLAEPDWQFELAEAAEEMKAQMRALDDAHRMIGIGR